jgi:DNA repair protein RadC
VASVAQAAARCRAIIGRLVAVGLTMSEVGDGSSSHVPLSHPVRRGTLMSTSLAPHSDEVGGYPLGRLATQHMRSGEDQPGENKRENTATPDLMMDGVELRVRRSQEHADRKRADLLKLLRHHLDDIGSKDLLYLFMTYVIPKEMAEPCSVSLLERFAGLGNLLSASWQRLETASEHVDGLAGPLKMLHAIVLAVLREPLSGGPVIDSWAKLKDHLLVSLRHCRVEMVRVLFLDEHNGLIKDELHSQGTVAYAPFRPHEAAQRAIQLGARSLILVHNHPAGNLIPSPTDVSMTLRFRDFLQRFGISLHDHVIVGCSECVSLRQLDHL